MDSPSAPSSLHRSCSFHPEREAVARCPDCGRPFCRECVVEHDFRMICAGCLARWKDERRRGREGRRSGRLAFPVFPFVHAGLAILIAWVGFLLLGRILLRIPTDFHEGIVPRDLLEEVLNPGGPS